jgi:hypothetical protein
MRDVAGQFLRSWRMIIAESRIAQVAGHGPRTLWVALLPPMEGIVTGLKSSLDERALDRLTLATDAAVLSYQQERLRLQAARKHATIDSELIRRKQKPAGTTKLPRQVATRRKKHSQSVATKSKRARTRTSLIGMTIYQPDLEPSAIGRKLLDALDRNYPLQKPLSR